MNRFLMVLFVLGLAFAGFSGTRSVYGLTGAVRVRPPTTTTNPTVVTPPPTTTDYRTPYAP